MQWECHAHDDTGSALGSSSVDIHGDLYQNIEVGDKSSQQMMMMMNLLWSILLDQTDPKLKLKSKE